MRTWFRFLWHYKNITSNSMNYIQHLGLLLLVCFGALSLMYLDPRRYCFLICPLCYWSAVVHFDNRHSYFRNSLLMFLGWRLTYWGGLFDHMCKPMKVMINKPKSRAGLNFFFSGLISTTSSVVFITARIASIFVSLTVVHIYDFHIFTIITNGHSCKQEHVKCSIRVFWKR